MQLPYIVKTFEQLTVHWSGPVHHHSFSVFINFAEYASIGTSEDSYTDKSSSCYLLFTKLIEKWKTFIQFWEGHYFMLCMNLWKGERTEQHSCFVNDSSGHAFLHHPFCCETIEKAIHSVKKLNDLQSLSAR